MTVEIPAAIIWFFGVVGAIMLVSIVGWFFWIYGGTKGWWKCEL